MLQSLWSVAWARVVDGVDTFGPKQATVKLFALQVGVKAQVLSGTTCSAYNPVTAAFTHIPKQEACRLFAFHPCRGADVLRMNICGGS